MSTIDLLPIAKLLLPEVLVKYFELTTHELEHGTLHFYFEEYKNREATSKGFYPEIKPQYCVKNH